MRSDCLASLAVIINTHAQSPGCAKHAWSRGASIAQAAECSSACPASSTRPIRPVHDRPRPRSTQRKFLSMPRCANCLDPSVPAATRAPSPSPVAAATLGPCSRAASQE
eukprot:2513193-Prymnesium_polylepis.1